MAKVAKIDIYTHHFVISRMNPNVSAVANGYMRDFIEYKQQYRRGVGMVSVPSKMYCASTVSRTEYRLHINTMDTFMNTMQMQGFVRSVFDITTHDVPTPEKVQFTISKAFKDREHQVPVIEYLVGSKLTKMVPLSTGLGKGYCTFRAIAKLKERFMVIVPGKYVQKWVDETLEMYPSKYKQGCREEDICVIRGGKSLSNAIEKALAGEFHYKGIIITSTTMQNFIKAYEKNDMEMYDCTPVELFEVLGVGIKVIDEVHENFHLNFKMELYSNVKTSIMLSATLKGDSGFINRMADIMFPPGDLITVIPPPKYIAATSLMYRLNNASEHVWLGKQGMYNHIEYEYSLIKHPEALCNYINMINDIIHRSFMSVREVGQKMLVFAASVEMCTELHAFFAEKYPELSVGRYVGEDDFEALHINDLIISTLGSSGTAVDIVNLRICLMTTAVNSSQRNIQALGRTRPLKGWPDVTPEFLYLTCTSIDTHLKYRTKKIELFADRVKSHNSLTLRDVI